MNNFDYKRVDKCCFDQNVLLTAVATVKFMFELN